MTGVVYGYSSVSIWGVLWGGATESHVTGSYMSGSYVTGSDVSHVTESKHQSGALSGSMFCACATESCAIFAPVGLFDRKWRKSRDRKKLWPEVGSAHARIFPRAFLLVVVPWRPDATKGHLTPFGVPLGLRNRKLCNTRSSGKQCWLGVFSMTFASYNHRKPPRPIFSYWN
jgi:hypothetical protein